jgi:hypothetical protein
MREMASEHNPTTFLPLPMDLLGAFLKKQANWKKLAV